MIRRSRRVLVGLKNFSLRGCDSMPIQAPSWASGRLIASHAIDPGSIPGGGIFFFFRFAHLLPHLSAQGRRAVDAASNAPFCVQKLEAAWKICASASRVGPIRYFGVFVPSTAFFFHTVCPCKAPFFLPPLVFSRGGIFFPSTGHRLRRCRRVQRAAPRPETRSGRGDTTRRFVETVVSGVAQRVTARVLRELLGEEKATAGAAASAR